MSTGLNHEPRKHLGAALSRTLHGFVDWLASGPDPQPPDIRNELVNQSLTKSRTLIVSIVVTALTAYVATVMTAAPWAYAWMLAVIFVGGVRLWLTNALSRAQASERNGKNTAPVLAGLIYFSVTSAGCYECVVSGQWPLLSISGFGLASLIGAVSSHHAGTPRLAILTVCILAAPFSIASLISPVPHLFILGIQLPLFAAAVIFGMFQNYEVLLNLHHSERENRRLAQHDLLTGLPNRALNLKRFDQLLKGIGSERGKLRQELMVFCLDLDGFKRVNDNLGHAAGDAILVAVARRLRDSVRPLDFVSRVGGDEFVILLPVISSDEAEKVAQRIIASISAPYDLGLPAPAHIGVSIGSACAPADGETADDLLRSADHALYEAKRRGKGNFVAYSAPEVTLAPTADADAKMADRRGRGTGWDPERTGRSPLPIRSKSV
jgi:diguanylate cyclase (GGDEF)-like protein